MKTHTIALLGLLLVSQAFAQNTSDTSEGPVAFSPTTSESAAAPNPAAAPRVRTGQYALDSLAATPTSYNQIQTIGVYSAAHVAPEAKIQDYLTGVTGVPGLTEAYSPNSTQFTQLQLYNQLDTYGVRSFHFPIYYDPTGKNYQVHAGLAIVNETANTSIADPKWGYPGWKVMNEPNFDFNTTCTTLATCLQNIKNWMLVTPATNPITIFLEPTGFTYTGNGSNATFAAALARSTSEDAPSKLNQPLNITSYKPTFQAWRDLENELEGVWDYNEFNNIVTPNDILDDADNLKEAVLQDGYTLYPDLNSLAGRLLFVLTGEYVQNYLEFKPDLVNATMFVSEPYNSDGDYSNSTLFVDFLGNVPGVNGTRFNSSAERTGVADIAEQITSTVKAGYMVRAAADWDTIEPRNNYSQRATSVQQAGAHFIQTSFPTPPTAFSSDYSVALAIRGNEQQAVACNPITTGGLYFNATAVYTVGCPAVSQSPAAAPIAAAG